MATWHQSRNAAGLSALWTQGKNWKVIDDKPGQLASGIEFADEAKARAYAAKTGGVLIPPAVESRPALGSQTTGGADHV